MSFLISALDCFSQLMGSSVSAGGVSGAVQQLPEVFCPSL
jgi:hypothetical protein